MAAEIIFSSVTATCQDVLSWQTVGCVSALLYSGLPLVVLHYKKSKDEMRQHYSAAWNISEGRTSAGYFGGTDPLNSGTDTRAWNDCPNKAAARFASFQREARLLSWDLRGAVRPKPVCLSNVLGPTCRPFFATVEVVVKKERPEYVREFIEHHLAVGFGHVYLAVNEDVDGVSTVQHDLREYIDHGLVTVWHNPDGQGVGHRSNVARYGLDTFWMARVDIDEFIVPQGALDSVVPFLLPLTGRPGMVPLQVKIGRQDMGDNGWKERPPTDVPMVEAYTRSKTTPTSVKSVIQSDGVFLNYIDKGNPHVVFTGSAENAGVTCQDGHWFLFLFVCWPQKAHIYWPPSRDEVVPPRTAAAQIVW
eukprot:CAMPEP_0194496002 /NCGR_PEP_ID=MMETSP0253-20130528/13420_1 /TAXON_ID=2966 /ORGANISM="Noctiluca scintillans" /LENGTH=361 /DNA_ID=CAMNT_0039337341 /DNA_START=102 /DNA_END=1184 /DNA_ORIENTATION=+